MASLELLAQQGWRIREQSFSSDILFSYPRETLPVSITGSKCELNCAHCGGHYLKSMKSLQEIKNGKEIKARSLLISGGCTAEGKVPIAVHIDRIAALKKERKCNMHVGLVDDEDISCIAKVADKVSFDFVGADETIREVFGLARTVEDYICCYQKLRKVFAVIPHLCIGLHGGEIKGEYRALKELKELGVSGITFIVFTPTRNTRFENCQPPAIEAVVELLVEARKDFPGSPLLLGCMRPGGSYRQKLDLWAIRSGINGIANPVPEAVRLADQLGLTIKKSEECCVL